MLSWHYFSMLGDSVITLPAAALITVWLLAGGAWRTGLWWSVLFGAGLGLVVMTKIAFVGWGLGISAWDFTGFSGHSMRASALFPVLFYLVLLRAQPAWRHAGIAFGLLLGILMAIARVADQSHSISEAVSGCILGGAIALGFIWVAQQLPKPRKNRWLLSLSFFCLLPTAYASPPAPTNAWIEVVALYLSGNSAPYVRNELGFAIQLPPHSRPTS